LIQPARNHRPISPEAGLYTAQVADVIPGVDDARAGLRRKLPGRPQLGHRGLRIGGGPGKNSQVTAQLMARDQVSRAEDLPHRTVSVPVQGVCLGPVFRVRCGRCPAADQGRGGLRFAFYGRVSTEDYRDPVTSRARQVGQAEALVAGHGQIVAQLSCCSM
jgi:hypothetical protein